VSRGFAPTLKGGGEGIAIFLPYFILAKNKINPMTFFALSFFKVVFFTDIEELTTYLEEYATTQSTIKSTFGKKFVFFNK
jgi:hypothetical protein